MRFSFESGVGLLEGDEAGGEVHEREVILGLLGPADQWSAVALHPGVTGLHNPTPGALGRVADLARDLLAARANVFDFE
jgi:hypothetical protein